MLFLIIFKIKVANVTFARSYMHVLINMYVSYLSFENLRLLLKIVTINS